MVEEDLSVWLDGARDVLDRLRMKKRWSLEFEFDLDKWVELVADMLDKPCVESNGWRRKL